MSENLEVSVENTDPKVIGSRSNLSKRLAIIAASFSFIFSIIASINLYVGDAGSASLRSSDGTSVTEGNFDWIPSSFNRYVENDNVAWRWAQGKENMYCGEKICVTAFFTTRDGCPNGIEATVVFYDSLPKEPTGSVLSIARESLPFLNKRMTGKLKFEDSTNTAKSAMVEKVVCS